MTHEIASGHQASSKVVTANTRSCAIAGAGPRYMRAQPKTSVMPCCRTSAIVAGLFSGASRNSGQPCAKAHETEFAVVGSDGTATDQFVAPGCCDVGGRGRSPEQLGIVSAGIPTLTGNPIDKLVQFGTGHVAYDQLTRHRSPQLLSGSMVQRQAVSALRDCFWPVAAPSERLQPTQSRL